MLLFTDLPLGWLKLCIRHCVMSDLGMRPTGDEKNLLGASVSLSIVPRAYWTATSVSRISGCSFGESRFLLITR
jgi:hypothetical protein